MAESEALGDARLDDPVDDPADTDGLAVRRANDVAAPGADGEFGYLLDEPGHPHPRAQVDDRSADLAEPPTTDWVAPPPFDSTEPPFDAFNAGTWNFRPTTVPWYRTRSATVALTAASLAVIALVVSVVLLAFRGSPGDTGVPAPVETSATSEAPTTATATVVTSELPLPPPPQPPPPPPPPPPPAVAPEIQRQAPVIVRQQPTKKPEINVTRSPMSVSPQMPKRP